jgi:hypothetical protein
MINDDASNLLSISFHPSRVLIVADLVRSDVRPCFREIKHLAFVLVPNAVDGTRDTLNFQIASDIAVF